MFIERIKLCFKPNEPIFTNEILELFSEFSRAYVFRLIKKAEEQGELINFGNGIYYLPIKNIVGLSTITVEDVVNKKYIQSNDEVYGIYSGMNLLNMFSITTQIPNTIEVVSNNEATRCRRIMIDGRTVIVHKSRCNIDKENMNAYVVLQLLSEIKDPNELDEVAISVIKDYIFKYGVKKDKLFELAKVFPAQTSRKLLHSGVLYDSTHA